MTIGDRIKSARIARGLSQVELACEIDVSKQTMYKYEKGIIANIPSDKIELIAEICHVTPAYLMGWEDDPRDWENIANEDGIYVPRDFDGDPIDYIKFKVLHETEDAMRGSEDPEIPNFPNIHPVKTVSLPILGSVSCGVPKFAEEEHASYIRADTDIRADFCLIADGDSMTGARIHDGDVVFVRKQPTVENGEIAVVCVEDEVTLKRAFYYPEKNLLILKPENPKHKELVYMDEDLEKVKILGKVVSVKFDVE